MQPRKRIHVVAAVIRRHGREMLVAKRASNRDQGGRWEFPGGKVEPGESRFEALHRELREELSISAEAAVPLIRLVHAYPDQDVDLDVWEVGAWSGDPRGVEGQPIQWVGSDAINRLEFPAANLPILSAISLPRVAFRVKDAEVLATLQRERARVEHSPVILIDAVLHAQIQDDAWLRALVDSLDPRARIFVEKTVEATESAKSGSGALYRQRLKLPAKAMSASFDPQFCMFPSIDSAGEHQGDQIPESAGRLRCPLYFNGAAEHLSRVIQWGAQGVVVDVPHALFPSGWVEFQRRVLAALTVSST